MSKAVPFFTKEEIKARILVSKAQGEPEMNLALLIAANALHGQKRRDGTDYDAHYLRVAFRDTNSRDKQVVGILHDVLEDSDWTVDDLREVGFSGRIVEAVDCLTKKDGESYFSFIRRCSANPDAVDRKLSDLKDNMDVSQSVSPLTAKQIEKLNIYIVSYQYLVAVKKNKIPPGAPVTDLLKVYPERGYDHAMIEKHSRATRLSVVPAQPQR